MMIKRVRIRIKTYLKTHALKTITKKINFSVENVVENNILRIIMSFDILRRLNCCLN